MKITIVIGLFLLFLGTLKLLNWKNGQNILWKAYRYDVLADFTFVTTLLLTFSFFDKKDLSLEIIAALMLFLLIILPGFFFSAKRKLLLRNGFQTKWYYPVNDINMALISLTLGSYLGGMF